MTHTSATGSTSATRSTSVSHPDSALHRVIAIDMDGTLLDDAGRIPEEFWPVMDELRQQGRAVAPASGRQLATLRSMFTDEHNPGTFIAENGTCVFHNGEIVSTTEMDPQTVHDVIDATRTSEKAGHDIDLVLCTPEMAYLDRWTDPVATAEIEKYYKATTHVDDLHDAAKGAIKLACYVHEDSETIGAPVLRDAARNAAMLVSGKHWIDIQHPEAGKGRALWALADTLGVPREATTAFGDYLNDMDMITKAGVSYAVANAHPDVIAAADRKAPANTEAGVVQVLRRIAAGEE